MWSSAEKDTISACLSFAQHQFRSAGLIGKAHFIAGHYADSLYRSLVESTNSIEWKAAVELREQKNAEFDKMVILSKV